MRSLFLKVSTLAVHIHVLTYVNYQVPYYPSGGCVFEKGRLLALSLWVLLRLGITNKAFQCRFANAFNWSRLDDPSVAALPRLLRQQFFELLTQVTVATW